MNPVSTSGFRLMRSAVVAVALGMLCFGLRAARAADTAQESTEGGGVIKPKGPVALTPKNVTVANGTATTVFSFHPEATVTSGYMKDAKTGMIEGTKNPFTHNYPSNTEIHNSTGSATYTLVLTPVAGNKFTVGGTVSATITPGLVKPPLDIKITADLKDPFVFSNGSNGQFNYLPGGLDYQFTLGSGTKFPKTFSPDNIAPGAIASGSSISFFARVAPGSLPDPDTFWSGGQAGAVDLFSLVLTSDNSHHVTAALTFGASTPDFTVDFSPSNIAATEAAISSAFGPDGTLSSDLSNLFRVGFVPGASLSEFTFGTRETTTITAVEVPEPGALTLLGIGTLLILGARRRVKPKTRPAGIRPSDAGGRRMGRADQVAPR